MGDLRWRDRLRMAVDNTGEKHSEIAWRAKINPATLSRILTGTYPRPALETIVRIARACNVTVSWVLDEPVRGIEFTGRERDVLKQAGIILLHAIRRVYEKPG